MSTHILFISDNFPPEVNAPASRTHEHCREWVRAGARVTVITCAPNFPKGRVFEGYRNRLWSREAIDGIEVLRVWSYIAANEGFLKRTLDYVSFMIAATIGALFMNRPDVIVATSPQFFSVCSGWMVSVLRRRPWVFELRDLWPESIRAVGALKNPTALAWLERIELFLYRRAAAIVCVTNSFRHNLIERGVDPDKITVVTNGADLSRFNPRPRDLALAEALGLRDRFIAGYVGTHGMAHGLGTVLDAAVRLAAEPAAARIAILMLGDGAAKAALVERSNRLGLTNVVFVGTVPRDEVSRYWSILDVSIIHLKRTDLFTTVIPSKLFECMAMGLPVLHGVAGESAEIVEREDAGLVVTPEDDRAMAAGLLRLSEDKALRTRFAAGAREAAGQYDRSTLARAMLAVLERVVKTHAASRAGARAG